MKRKSLEIVDVDTQQLEEVLTRAEQSLNEDDAQLIRAVFESYTYVADLVDDKRTTIHRLRKLLFGARTEKTDNVVGSSSTAPAEDVCHSSTTQPTCEQQEDHELSAPQRGHGRNGADAYRGAKRVEVAHESLTAGDPCPACEHGTVYETSKPGVLVRIAGQPPLQATVYQLQKLRCHLCGKVFTAQVTKGVGSDKYGATAASMIALLKYGSGLPFNRLEGLQRNLEIPLPASTQWDIVHALATCITPAYEELIRQAAQGDVLHNDDTTVKILELMGQRDLSNRDDQQLADRSGVFTSGVVATREGQRLALFFSGRRHAGENLADVLKLRAQELAAPIQMCDGLSRNLPAELETIVANCLAHARRQFVEIHDRFPDECRRVLEALKVVYHNDAMARKKEMSPEKRLRHHRIKSQQTMTRLHTWLNRQFDQKLVEPNSALGGAIKYMLKRWDKLTLFLREPGAPLDNNICERALKKAILHRKNALFYKTQNGARVGDIHMSLIHTCELSKVSPFHYLTELQQNADELAVAPDRWMPWNYQATLEANRAA